MNERSIEPRATADICAAAEASASFILESGLVGSWVKGAILPSEMAFFLAACDVRAVESVVECGRQDGYSTEILGRWARLRGAEVISIDLEDEAARAARCRARLRDLPLELIKGNAFAEVGRVMRRLRGRRTAGLFDGPKGFPAISLMVAALDDHVELLALHNLVDWKPERKWFTARGGCFYEDLIGTDGSRWAEMRRQEDEHVSSSTGRRSLDVSSLGVLMLGPGRREELLRAWSPVFGLHQPLLVLWFSQIFGYDLTPKLYGLSRRLLGR
jgi:hypothetical protein